MASIIDDKSSWLNSDIFLSSQDDTEDREKNFSVQKK